MAGTKVGAVFLDLKLNTEQLDKGLARAEAGAEALRVSFLELQKGILAAFSARSLGPVMRSFDVMSESWAAAWQDMTQVFAAAAKNIVAGMNALAGGFDGFKADVGGRTGQGSRARRLGAPQMAGISVPMMARGGIVNAPTLAMIGERGAEAVLPLENNTGWMADLANMLAGAAAANRPSEGGTKVELHLDGRKMAEGLVDDLRDVCRRRDLEVIT